MVYFLHSHTNTHARTQTQTHTHTHTHTHTQFVYVCMYVCMHVCMYVCIHRYTICQTSGQIYMVYFLHSDTHTRTQFMRIYMYVCMYTQVHFLPAEGSALEMLFWVMDTQLMYVCMYACMYVCMYVCMYAYTGTLSARRGLGGGDAVLGDGRDDHVLLHFGPEHQPLCQFG